MSASVVDGLSFGASSSSVLSELLGASVATMFVEVGLAVDGSRVVGSAVGTRVGSLLGP